MPTSIDNSMVLKAEYSTFSIIDWVIDGTNYEKNLIKRNNLPTFLDASSQLGSLLSFYVCFVLEKRVCKKWNFFLNGSKDVLLAHCCFPCLACDKDRNIVCYL